jgi:hypothetical protein
VLLLHHLPTLSLQVVQLLHLLLDWAFKLAATLQFGNQAFACFCYKERGIGFIPMPLLCYKQFVLIGD